MKIKPTSWSAHFAWGALLVAAGARIGYSAQWAFLMSTGAGAAWEVVGEIITRWFYWRREPWWASVMDWIPWLLGAAAGWIIWR
jgi:hypothetical protein